MQKYLVFGQCSINGFSWKIVEAPSTGKAMKVAEEIYPPDHPFHGSFKASQAVTADYLRVLANDVDTCELPPEHVYKESKKCKSAGLTKSN